MAKKRKQPIGIPYRSSDGNIYFIDLDKSWNAWHRSSAITETRTLYRHSGKKEPLWFLLVEPQNITSSPTMRAIIAGINQKQEIPTGKFMVTREAANWLIEHRGPLPDDAVLHEAIDWLTEQSDSQDSPRPAYSRDHLWLKWYQDETADTYHSYAAIRDKWNSIPDDERKRLSLKYYGKLASGKRGTDPVKTGIAKARREI